jgi:diguanylate cyclase (GGDEF)-like protein
MRLLEEERERMQRTGQPFAVALLDIDNFKRVNDECGHIVGDEVLRVFTQRVAREMRSTDRLGRYGGEEFLLLLTGPQQDNGIALAADRVRRGVAEAPWREIDAKLEVTVSAGVSMARANETATQLLARADTALYLAKRDGRNCVRVG